MKRYSIASSSSRRKSNAGSGGSALAGFGGASGGGATGAPIGAPIGALHASAPHSADAALAAADPPQLERLEQEITLALQEIDKNLAKSNAIINDKIFPVLRNYGRLLAKVWSNVNFWKYFMEQAANVELAGYEEPIRASEAPGAAPAAAAAADPQDAFKRPRVPPASEETPTWDEPPAKRMHASTPQRGGPSRPLAATGATSLPPLRGTAVRFDSTDSFRLQPPATRLESPVSHTLRQLLDTYHKVLISPRKRTPTRERSLLVRELIESSPTLPEPPKLLLGRDSSGGSRRQSRAEPSSQLDRRDSQGRERFPLTPKYRTSLSAPGSARNTGSPRRSPRSDSADDIPPLPELTIERRQSVLRNEPPPAPSAFDDNDPENVFLENSATANAAAHTAADAAATAASPSTTIYHSVLKQSRENTHSATYNLFQEVLETSGLRGPDAAAAAAGARDLFEDITGNLTSDMGSFLGERFRKFTQ